MIFKTNHSSNGIRIPTAALRLGLLDNEKELNLHVQHGVLTILPTQMTAEQLLQTVGKLHALQELPLDQLEESCGPCNACCGAMCPLEDAPVPEAIGDTAGAANHWKLLIDRGLCLGRLYEQMRTGEPIYGGR